MGSKFEEGFKKVFAELNFIGDFLGRGGEVNRLRFSVLIMDKGIKKLTTLSA